MAKTEGKASNPDLTFPMITSDNELEKIILDRSNFVVTLLCDEAPDLEIFNAKLKRLKIDFVRYCPFYPFHDSSDDIRQFFRRVERARKGVIPLYSSNTLWQGLSKKEKFLSGRVTKNLTLLLKIYVKKLFTRLGANERADSSIFFLLEILLDFEGL